MMWVFAAVILIVAGFIGFQYIKLREELNLPIFGRDTQYSIERNAIKRANDMGIKDLKIKYDLKDIVKGDSIFCATGITKGELVNGIEVLDGYFMTDTFVTHKSKNIKMNVKEKVKKIL